MRVSRPKPYQAWSFLSCLLERSWSLIFHVGSWVLAGRTMERGPVTIWTSLAEVNLLASSWKSKTCMWSLVGSYKPGTRKLWPTGQLPDFVDEIVLEHNHSHLFTYRQQLFTWCQQGWAAVRDTMSHKPWNVHDLTFTEKVCDPYSRPPQIPPNDHRWHHTEQKNLSSKFCPYF